LTVSESIVAPAGLLHTQSLKHEIPVANPTHAPRKLHIHCFRASGHLSRPAQPLIDSAAGQWHITTLDILAEPADAIAVPLAHHHRAHEHFNGSDAFQRHLALSGGLVQTNDASQVFFRDGIGICTLSELPRWQAPSTHDQSCCQGLGTASWTVPPWRA
jgi:hypothetical protein